MCIRDSNIGELQGDLIHEGGVFMENKYVKIKTAGTDVALKVMPGHYATNHAHINYYIDMTTMKTRTSEAQEPVSYTHLNTGTEPSENNMQDGEQGSNHSGGCPLS